MFNFPKCPKCGNTLPIATGVCATCPISPLPGQEDQSALLAVSAEVGQVEGTTRVSLKDFEDRLNDLLCFLPSGRLTEDQFNETLQGMNCDLLIIQTRGFLKSAIATLTKIRSDSEQGA